MFQASTARPSSSSPSAEPYCQTFDLSIPFAPLIPHFQNNQALKDELLTESCRKSYRMAADTHRIAAQADVIADNGHLSVARQATREG
jgi:hypothetical protein